MHAYYLDHSYKNIWWYLKNHTKIFFKLILPISFPLNEILMQMLLQLRLIFTLNKINKSKLTQNYPGSRLINKILNVD
jgi:hypothetical protein